MNRPGDNKPRVGLLPDYLIEIVRAMEHGADGDHEEDSWRSDEFPPELFSDALWRHAERIRCGELVDPKSGLPHAAHAGAGAMIFGVKTRERSSGLHVVDQPFSRAFRNLWGPRA